MTCSAWETLHVTVDPEKAEKYRADAKAKRWPITLYLRELLKDGERYRQEQTKESEKR